MNKEKTGKLLRASLLAAAVAMALLALLLYTLPKSPDVSSAEGRAAFLSALGWEIDPGSEEARRVLIPNCAEGVMADYNALQLSQGYDLSGWEGKEVMQYTYRLLHYPGYEQTVYVTLYVSGRRVIAGDVHTAALGGFMHGLTRGETT